jgi:hypothetical protein
LAGIVDGEFASAIRACVDHGCAPFQSGQLGRGQTRRCRASYTEQATSGRMPDLYSALPGRVQSIIEKRGVVKSNMPSPVGQGGHRLQQGERSYDWGREGPVRSS